MNIRHKRFYRRLRIIYYKLLRAKGTPHSVALAVAIGFFVACATPPGIHTIIILLLAFIFRTDKIIAFLATWISNPYTIPVMYPFFCYIGSKILGSGLTFSQINRNLFHLFSSFSWERMKLTGEQFAESFLVGGILFGVILGVIGYLLTFSIVVKYRKQKEARKHEKRLEFYKKHHLHNRAKV